MAQKRALSAPSPYHFQYAAKFLCTANIPGTSQTTDSLLPGVYQTVVNIHNPNERTVRLRMKIADLLGARTSTSRPPVEEHSFQYSLDLYRAGKIGRASCRERVCQYV